MQKSITLTQISKADVVFQCDRRNRLVLDFAGEQTVLKLDAFLRLKQAVDSVDLEQMATSTDRASDLEIISVCGCEKCFILTLPQLCALKELLAEAKFSLQLNSLLHECFSAQIV